MSLAIRCDCGRELVAEEAFAGARAECPDCGAELRLPLAATSAQANPTEPSAASDDPAVGDPEPQVSPTTEAPKPLEIRDFIDPPASASAASATPATDQTVLKRMLDALLDPRAIQWLLMLGGGLFVLGLLIWLISIGVFKDPWKVAVAIGLGSVSVLAAGWFIALRTSHRTAGHAITFLGCVVLPLNLWFYHAQGLVTLEDNLWLGGVICVAFYVLTVYLLRSPLFMYAVEAGLTLTVMLLMADLNQMRGEADFCFWLIGLAAFSIVAQRGFAREGEFNRSHYGMPLFWSGQVQLAAAIAILFVSQCTDWLAKPLGLSWPGNRLTENATMAGGIWIFAAILYVYSDVAVRRLKIYSIAAAFCVLMAFATTVLPSLPQEALIALLAITALMAHLAAVSIANQTPAACRNLTLAASVLSMIPVLMGILLHARATSGFATEFNFAHDTGWGFVGAMLVVAIANRISAWLSKDTDRQMSSNFFAFSAAGLIIAAAGLLRQIGWTDWSQQAAVLMIIPLGYLGASRLYRGRYAEAPLQYVAHAATIIILLGVVGAAIERDPQSLFVAVKNDVRNLLLGVALLEGCLFYSLLGLWQHQGRNVFGATAMGCGAIWQFLGYFGLATVWYPLMFAVAGVTLLVISRVMGLEMARRFQSKGDVELRVRGTGLMVFFAGNAVLTVALVAAFMKGLSGLGRNLEWLELFALLLTTAAAAAAAILVPAKSGWRQWYTTAGAGLAVVTLLTFNLLIDLSRWQKIEFSLVMVGILLLVINYLRRFRDTDAGNDDSITSGLAMGSVLAAGPLFIAVCSHRWTGGPSFWDEIALLTVSVLMLATGLIGQMKSPTLMGATTLVLYLVILIGSLVHQPQIAIGIYMMGGAALLFAAGVVASIYRDRLLALPDQISRREGFFKVIGWR